MNEPKGSSREAVFFIQIIYLILLGLFVIAYRVDLIEPRREFFGPVPFLVPWFGAVGATLLSLAGVFEHRADWDPRYCYWHWARPIVGAIVGTVSVLIFQAGILAVGGETPGQAGTSTPKNLLYYVMAFVVGYKENLFRELIGRVASLLFTSASEEGGAAPVILSVDPPSAAPGQATDVKLVGTGLASVTSVKLGGQDLRFVGESDTRMTVTVPADAEPGEVSLVIAGKEGTASRQFTIA